MQKLIGYYNSKGYTIEKLLETGEKKIIYCASHFPAISLEGMSKFCSLALLELAKDNKINDIKLEYRD